MLVLGVVVGELDGEDVVGEAVGEVVGANTGEVEGVEAVGDVVGACVNLIHIKPSFNKLFNVGNVVS